MADKVRRQHYVWRKYLEAWTTDGKVWCRRGEKVFHTEPMNIAQERDFYIPEPLNDVERLFLRKEAQESDRPDILELVEDEISFRDEMFAALDAARAAGDVEAARNLEATVHNSEEGYQGQIEQAGLDNLAELVGGRIAWAYDEKRKQTFILFFATQYLRTKRIQEKIKSFLSEQSADLGYSVERLLSIQRNIDVVRLCEGIYGSTSLVLLSSPRGTEFITCDQPAFNVNAVLTPGRFRELPHEFYYPVSPSHAVVMMDGPRHPPNAREATADEVERYNRAMREASLDQIFGRTRCAVERP